MTTNEEIAIVGQMAASLAVLRGPVTDIQALPVQKIANDAWLLFRAVRDAAERYPRR